MATYEADLIRRARELQRLVTKRNRLKRNLRAVETEIKTARKALKAIQQVSEGRRPDAAPSRLHAGVTAVGLAHREVPTFEAFDRAGRPVVMTVPDDDDLGI